MQLDLVVSSAPIASLMPYAENARTHSPSQVAQIAASIAEFGFVNPVLVDAEGVLIAGHGRVMAAKQLGLASVPVLRLGHLSPAQARALRLADNQIALNSGWDEALLAAEIARIRDEAVVDLDVLGFAGMEDEQSAAAIARRNAERRAAAEAAAEGDAPTDDAKAAQAAPLTEEIALLDRALAARAATPRASLRDTAAAILAAWDDQAARFGTHDGDLIGALDAPMAALRTLLAGKPTRAPRDASAPRKPREGTKQEQVLAMLRRPEGATVAQIADATGWAQHTVRGFFAGLKKRQGIEVQVLERVRQVGPNKQGSKGSLSIYNLPG